jgi:hypothetical protein
MNVWGADSEEKIEISRQINDYLDDQDLDEIFFVALTTYPEKIRTLNEASLIRCKRIFAETILDGAEYASAVRRLMSASDLLPEFRSIFYSFAQENMFGNLRDYYEDYISEILGKDEYLKTFGKILMEEFRKDLRTCNGYVVNPSLEAIKRRYGFWKFAEVVSEEEKEELACELIESLNSNNFSTMSLLKFDKDFDCPESWVYALLEAWSEMIISSENKNFKSLHYGQYIGQYLNLAYQYERRQGREYKKTRDVLEALVNLDDKLHQDVDREVNKLDDILSSYWQKLLAKSEKGS